jgi:hypothetical protein
LRSFRPWQTSAFYIRFANNRSGLGLDKKPDVALMAIARQFLRHREYRQPDGNNPTPE